LETGRKRKSSVRVFWLFHMLEVLIFGIIESSFDMMNKRLYKTYVNLSNIVMRVSNGTSEGKEHAVLVNSHLDSTLPSPGAADDAISVGVSFVSPYLLSIFPFLFFPLLLGGVNFHYVLTIPL
jgi:hypothetical protein